MGSEVPRCVNVHADWTEVGADHRNMEDFPQVSAVDDPGGLSHSSVEEEDMTDHESEARDFSKSYKLVRRRCVMGNGLFYQHMLAGRQSCLHEFMMGARRCRDDDCIYRRIVKCVRSVV